MPIHLPPISRRDFLRRSAAGFAALTAGPELFAESNKRDADFVALFSDTHLAADRARINNGVNMADNFSAVSKELLALPSRPANLFVTGDCAYSSGETGDYETLTQLLDPIRQGQIPVHLALGNHDNREHFWESLKDEKDEKRPLADRQVGLVKMPRANWLILDSLEKTLATPGLLGQEQLDWLAKTLDSNQKKPAIVLVHHNPWLSGNLGLKDTQAFFDIIRPRRQVKAYIYGHTHTWTVQQDSSGIHLVNLPPVAYVFQQGQPSGWVRADLKSDGMRLELRSIDPSHNSHGQVVELPWRV